uniref:hypothetical protein n=1 Tax=Candidatus Electronema sp. TaxID=2698783 RepID=UPI004056CB43
MMNSEPKCIQWKRKGAERVASLTAGMSREQELEFWHKRTELLKIRKNRQKQGEKTA